MESFREVALAISLQIVSVTTNDEVIKSRDFNFMKIYQDID